LSWIKWGDNLEGVRLATVEDVKDMSLIHAQTWKSAYTKYISEEYLNNIIDEGWIPLFTRAFVQNLHEAAIFELDDKITGTVTFGRGRPMISCITGDMSKSDKTSLCTTDNSSELKNNSSCSIDMCTKTNNSCGTSGVKISQKNSNCSSKTDVNIRESSSCDLNNCDDGEIISLYVLPKYWSTKQGYELTRFAVERLKSQGYKSCYLWVIKENDRAVNFYKRFGFKSTAEFTTVMLAGQAVIEEKYRIYF